MSKAPSDGAANGPTFRRFLVLALFVGVAAAFLTMIGDYLLAIFLAAIFSTVLHPIYRRVLGRCGGRAPLASAIMLTCFILAIGVPLVFMLGLVANEAVVLSKSVVPWIQQQLSDPVDLSGHLPDWLPFADALDPYRAQIRERLQDATRDVGGALFAGLTRATGSTVDFGISLFVFLYAMFFFLMRGAELFHSGLRYLPLGVDDRNEVIGKGLSVARATLKSILVIGLLQGVLVGVAFWIVGIDGPAFWGTVVLVMAAIPVLGTPIIWGPAAAWLMMNGQVAEGVGLAVWGTLVVGLVDNILRPRIVGEESKLPDLVVLIAILGGIGAFGAVGIIVGPVVAAVFFVVLDIYGHTFADVLPADADSETLPPPDS